MLHIFRGPKFEVNVCEMPKFHSSQNTLTVHNWPCILLGGWRNMEQEQACINKGQTGQSVEALHLQGKHLQMPKNTTVSPIMACNMPTLLEQNPGFGTVSN